MSPSPYNGLSPDPDRQYSGDSWEDTLRLIARLPAPEGLTDRVHAGLRHAPQSGRVLRWRAPLRPARGWMHGRVARGAAAAMIVGVVAGGGWTIYSRISPASTGRVISSPVGPGGGGFAPAGAKRLPETLQGPVLTHPVSPGQPVAESSRAQSRPVLGAAKTKKKKAGHAPAVASAP